MKLKSLYKMLVNQQKSISALTENIKALSSKMAVRPEYLRRALKIVQESGGGGASYLDRELTDDQDYWDTNEAYKQNIFNVPETEEEKLRANILADAMEEGDTENVARMSKLPEHIPTEQGEERDAGIRQVRLPVIANRIRKEREGKSFKFLKKSIKQKMSVNRDTLNRAYNNKLTADENPTIDDFYLDEDDPENYAQNQRNLIGANTVVAESNRFGSENSMPRLVHRSDAQRYNFEESPLNSLDSENDERDTEEAYWRMVNSDNDDDFNNEVKLETNARKDAKEEGSNFFDREIDIPTKNEGESRNDYLNRIAPQLRNLKISSHAKREANRQKSLRGSKIKLGEHEVEVINGPFVNEHGEEFYRINHPKKGKYSITKNELEGIPKPVKKIQVPHESDLQESYVRKAKSFKFLKKNPLTKMTNQLEGIE